MLNALLKRLTTTSPDNTLDAEDSRLALAALMVRVARADHDYAAAEIKIIDQVLMQKYALDETSAQQLRAEAEKVEAEAPDTVRFTRMIKDAVPYEDRNAVVENLWKIVLADQKRDENEDSFLRLVSSLLGVSDVDSARARQRILKS